MRDTSCSRASDDASPASEGRTASWEYAIEPAQSNGSKNASTIRRARRSQEREMERQLIDRSIRVKVSRCGTSIGDRNFPAGGAPSGNTLQSKLIVGFSFNFFTRKTAFQASEIDCRLPFL